MRFVVLLVSLVVGFAGPAAARDFQKTCDYFTNVAFNDLHTLKEETFRVALAKDCAAALDLYHTSRTGSDGWTRAETYLVTLQSYRQALMDMASARFEIARPTGGRTDGLYGRLMVRQVSRTGAYLIARSMGLVGVQRDWRNWMAAQLAD
ncbi:hypothetical protein [Halovulum sp. GXIMD14793]